MLTKKLKVIRLSEPNFQLCSKSMVFPKVPRPFSKMDIYKCPFFVFLFDFWEKVCKLYILLFNLLKETFQLFITNYVNYFSIFVIHSETNL